MQDSRDNQNNHTPRPGTPPRPPYSPVTPVFAHLTPSNGAAHPIIPPATSPSPTTVTAPYGSISAAFPPPATPPVFAPEPAPVPISESENPDAIALRSAISILQLQKQQSLRDIQTLQKMKVAAAADPEKFARELEAGKLSAKDPGGFINFTHDDNEDEEEAVPDGSGGGGGGDIETAAEDSGSGLGTLPTPQNVVRMPPVNWAKYQVVGESLEKMHEEQRKRPSAGEPRREEYTQPAPEHILASPYRPLVDKLETPAKPKGVSKNKKG